MRTLPLLLALASTPAWPLASGEHVHGDEPSRSGNSQIIVTINPEVRVSAVVAAPLPAPRPCGQVAELAIRVENQGFVTAPLRASIVGSGSDRVALHMDGTKLSGHPDDERLLHLIPFGPAATDVTIAFGIDDGPGDLGGRDQVHILLNCISSQ